MSCVRNVLLYLGGSLTIFANLSCVAIDPAPTASIRTSRIDLQPCHFPRHKSELLCGKYPVFEDRAAKAGRMIPLNIVVLPAITVQPKPDPVFFLSGGPGQGAARAAGAREHGLMRELRRERDLIFIDLRGTGDSNRLQCSSTSDRTSAQSYFAEIFPLERVHACRETLGGIADLRLYTTPIAMDDFEEVRAALGYAKLISTRFLTAPRRRFNTCASTRRGCAPLYSPASAHLRQNFLFTLPKELNSQWIGSLTIVLLMKRVPINFQI